MKTLANCGLGLLIMVGIYFGYLGIISKPIEGDSLAYHIPIARIIADGMMWHKTAYTNVLFYYPAFAETVLAGMIKVGVPLNLFGLIGWALLVWGMYRWGKVKGLGVEMSLLLAMSVGMWTTVLRLVLNQTVDIWLAVWWVWLVMNLDKPKLNFAMIGLLAGALVGTKYSGVGYVFVIGLFYAQRIVKQLSAKKFLVLILGIAVSGGVWYFRNWQMTGNPIYPGSLWWWQGAANFHLQDWTPIKTLFGYPGGLRLFVEALVSEYLIWAVVPAMVSLVKKREMFLGWLNLGVFLITPSWPINIVSDLRYTIVAMIPMAMAIYLWAKENRKREWLGGLAILGAVAAIPQLNYLPKLLMISLVSWGVVTWKRKI